MFKLKRRCCRCLELTLYCICVIHFGIWLYVFKLKRGCCRCLVELTQCPAVTLLRWSVLIVGLTSQLPEALLLAPVAAPSAVALNIRLLNWASVSLLAVSSCVRRLGLDRLYMGFWWMAPKIALLQGGPCGEERSNSRDRTEVNLKV